MFWDDYVIGVSGAWSVLTRGSYQIHITGLTPTVIPEPATITLLTSGLLGMASFARRRLRR